MTTALIIASEISFGRAGQLVEGLSEHKEGPITSKGLLKLDFE
jgi:hypothetical protein